MRERETEEKIRLLCWSGKSVGIKLQLQGGLGVLGSDFVSGTSSLSACLQVLPCDIAIDAGLAEDHCHSGSSHKFIFIDIYKTIPV